MKKPLILLTTLAGLGAVCGLAYHFYNEEDQQAVKNEHTSSSEKVLKDLKDALVQSKSGSSHSINKKSLGKSSEQRKTTGIIPPAPDDSFPLQPGSYGPRVAKLQAYMLRRYGWTQPIKGYFDDYTLERIKRHLRVSKISEELYRKLRIQKLKLS